MLLLSRLSNDCKCLLQGSGIDVANGLLLLCARYAILQETRSTPRKCKSLAEHVIGMMAAQRRSYLSSDPYIAYIYIYRYSIEHMHINILQNMRVCVCARVMPQYVSYAYQSVC